MSQVCLGRQSVSQTINGIISEGGLRQLYRGSGVILVRAFPTNAATFLAYEWTIRGLVNMDSWLHTQTSSLKLSRTLSSTW